MAQERIESLIGTLRGLIGDEYERTTAALITTPLTQDGTGWTAQTMANAFVLAANEIIETAVMQLRDPAKVALMFPEHHKTAVLSDAHYLGGEGSYSRYTPPPDFGWEIGGRFKQDGKVREWVVRFDASLRHVDGAIISDNPEDAYSALAWREGDQLVITLGGPVLTMQDVFVVRYLALQPAISLTSATDDILMSARWDLQLLKGAKLKLLEFKQ